VAELITVARPYAEAIFDLGKEGNSLDQWSKDLQVLVQSYNNEIMQRFINNPRRTIVEVENVFDSVLEDRVEQSTINFVRLLVKNRRLQALPLIKNVFEDLKAKDMGSIEVVIVTAFELDQEEINRLTAVISKKIEKTISPVTRVDESLIGGIRVEFGDKVWDLSINGQLKDMNLSLI